MALSAKGKTFFLRIGFVLAIVVLLLGIRTAGQHGYGRKLIPSFLLPKEIDIAGGSQTASLQGAPVASFSGLPGTSVANISNPLANIRIKFWSWSAQAGCEYSNGGPVTTENSLVAQQNLKINFMRENDNDQLTNELTAFTKELHDGTAEPTKGVHFIGIMGDGAHQYLDAINHQLIKAFGPDYHAEIIGSCGISYGEDKLMGPKKWRDNPQTLRGSVIAGVIGDGDWNIAMRYAGSNDVPNNPDKTTYDPDAMNWVGTSSFTDAATKYVNNYCEDRKVVHTGKLTGETKHVCVEGAVTWTPGDVTMAEQRGGVVSVISTKQYTNEMPQVIIGIHAWDSKHSDAVTKMLYAFLQGGNQVKSFPQALDRASVIENTINHETGTDAGYWKKVYIGYSTVNANQDTVELGGSQVYNIADNLLLFGLTSGESPDASRFHATYTVFGNLVHKMYPQLVPDEPNMNSILDLTYLRGVENLAGSNTGKAEVATYAPNATITHTVGRQNIHINFVTGSAQLTPQGTAQLNQLADELTTNSLLVQVNGYTDNTGSDAVNQKLSEDRASAVKIFLENRSKVNFPQGRVTATGYGSSNAVADNATTAGKAANRRVEIIVGTGK